MFEFPIRLPENTHYDKLGVGADSGDLIREFLLRETSRVKGCLRRVTTELLKIQQDYPDYQATKDRLKELQGSDENGDPAQYRLLYDRLRRTESQIVARWPHFKELESEKERLELELNELNNSPLHAPEDRGKYNRAHPPLDLLAIVPYDIGQFADRRTVCDEIRRNAGAFLEAQGQYVPPPSDLGREDFRGDFELCAALDEEP